MYYYYYQPNLFGFIRIPTPAFDLCNENDRLWLRTHAFSISRIEDLHKANATALCNFQIPLCSLCCHCDSNAPSAKHDVWVAWRDAVFSAIAGWVLRAVNTACNGWHDLTTRLKTGFRSGSCLIPKFALQPPIMHPLMQQQQQLREFS